MELTLGALAETRRAFDGVAGDYDRANAANPILRAMRRRMLAAIRAHTPAGGAILDLGCGPGTDAEVLARAGYTVTAIDWSPAMVREARQRVARLKLDARVDVFQLGIHELHRLPPRQFDTVCSNFGPLNCVPSLPDAMQHVGRRLRPGGAFIASVIGRLCPWEIALYGLRGAAGRAFVRFRRGFVPVPLNGRTVWTRYYTPHEFERACAASGFTRASLRALGLFAPPPYLEAFAARHPGLIDWLHRLDDVAGGWPVVRHLGDHFLLVLRKT